MRHSGGVLVWRDRHPITSTAPLNEHGARYLIARLDGTWILTFLPRWTLAKGHEVVAQPPGRRTLASAKRAAAEHWLSVQPGQESSMK